MFRLVYYLYARRLTRGLRRRPLPRHIGIILDGNRRHGRALGITEPRALYDLGADKLDDVLEWCAELAIPTVTLWVFSTENFLRPAAEVSGILASVEAKLTALAADPAFVRKLGVPADRLEGFLYPDTYSFTHGFTEESVLTKMVSRALEELKAASAQRSPAVTLNPLQTMTLASIVEKETGAPDERPRIACLFYNRLRIGMPLQTDPTVLYAMMLIRGKFVKNITKADLSTPHPYNTYTVKGLPPGPIASPGAASLKAVNQPATCTDLYFVSKNDGTHYFSKTVKEHEAAVDKYQRGK